MPHPIELKDHRFEYCDGADADQHVRCPATMKLTRPRSLADAREVVYVCQCSCHREQLSLFAPGVPWKE